MVTLEHAGDLFVIRVRGLIARMITIHCGKNHCEAPAHLMKLVRGPEANLTLRSIAEAAHECGFHIDFIATEWPEKGADDEYAQRED